MESAQSALTGTVTAHDLWSRYCSGTVSAEYVPYGYRLLFFGSVGGRLPILPIVGWREAVAALVRRLPFASHSAIPVAFLGELQEAL